MTGATSPRLQLELLVARVLAQGAAVAAPAVAAVAAPPVAERAGSPVAERAGLPPVVERAKRDETPARGRPAAGHRERGSCLRSPSERSPPKRPPRRPAVRSPCRSSARPGRRCSAASSRSAVRHGCSLRPPSRVQLSDDVLTLTFQSQSDVAKFKQLSAGAGPSEDLRTAIQAVLGIRVKYIAKHDVVPPDDGPPPPPDAPESPPPSSGPPSGTPRRQDDRRARGAAPARASAAPVTEWAVASIPGAETPAGPPPHRSTPRAARPRPSRSSRSTTSRKTPPPRVRGCARSR